MVAVESALQERFGSHAGWAHNTLFISELASQRHVLPAHLHPGARGRAGKKSSSLPEPGSSAADMAGPVTPPQQLGRGKRSAARSAGAKRRAVDRGDIKNGGEEGEAAEQETQSHPSPTASTPERSAAKAWRRKRAEPVMKQENGVKTESEVQPAAAAEVSELVESAALEAFAEVRQVGQDAGVGVAHNMEGAQDKQTQN